MLIAAAWHGAGVVIGGLFASSFSVGAAIGAIAAASVRALAFLVRWGIASYLYSCEQTQQQTVLQTEIDGLREQACASASHDEQVAAVRILMSGATDFRGMRDAYQPNESVHTDFYEKVGFLATDKRLPRSIHDKVEPARSEYAGMRKRALLAPAQRIEEIAASPWWGFGSDSNPVALLQAARASALARR